LRKVLPAALVFFLFNVDPALLQVDLAGLVFFFVGMVVIFLKV
jgi:hypothetical protein